MKFFFKLTFLEIRKLICKKYVVALLLVMTVALGWYMNKYFKIDHSEWKADVKLYRTIEGQLTEDKYNGLVRKMNSMEQYIFDDGEVQDDGLKGEYMPTRAGDAMLIQSAIYDCDFVLQNEANRQKIISYAKNNIEEFSSRPGKEYKIAFNKKIVSTYKKQPQIYIMNHINKTMWYACLSFNVHSVLIIIFLIIVIIPVFVGEKENGMQIMIDTYTFGKMKLFLAKTAAVVVISIFTTVFFEVLQLLFFKLLIPELMGLKYPVQSVWSMCPFNVTIGEFILLKILYASLASVAMGVSVMLFSAMFSKTIQSISCSVIFAAAVYGIVFYQKIWQPEIMRERILEHNEEILSGFKTYLFTYLYYPYDYFKQFECINIFGQPVFSQTIICHITVLIIILFIVSSYFLYVKDKKRI